jgi:alpha-L-arabinofuranosidase
VADGKLHPPEIANHLTGEVRKKTFKWNDEEIPAWTLEAVAPARATMRVTKENPPFAEAPHNLRLAIAAATPTAPVSVVNSGYWGMGIQKDAAYKLRFYLRAAVGHTGKVTAKILSADGATLAAQTFAIRGDGAWGEHTATLTAAATDARARLALVFDAPGAFHLDYVSLFPVKTFRDRPNGLRKDVAEFVTALRPAFVRWPGGCVVEGITLSNRFEWKKSLGDPARRPGQYSIWGYRYSYGFGYHEFLQYCEDIGADGMFVCSVGLACQFRSGEASPESEIVGYLQDTLDAIEYALGGISTPWGAKRAAAGHPAPFPLKYVEIGNENWGAEYDRRFDIFYKAIKEKHPQLTLISNNGLGKNNMITPSGVAKTDMIDPHWYENPDFFFKSTHIFDGLNRDGPKIYVGEYAVNRDVGGGNLLGALAEAAFISGMERNGDLVQMCSYAPLLENSNDRGWPVNLIWLDSGKVLGRSSYYVQRMFAENRPDYNLRADFQAAAPRQSVIAGYDEARGEVVLKVVNANPFPMSARVDLRGAADAKPPALSGKGKAIVLSSEKLTDENSFAAPLKIAPVESDIDVSAPLFDHTFAPNSLTILRIGAKRQ